MLELQHDTTGMDTATLSAVSEGTKPESSREAAARNIARRSDEFVVILFDLLKDVACSEEDGHSVNVPRFNTIIESALELGDITEHEANSLTAMLGKFAIPNARRAVNAHRINAILQRRGQKAETPTLTHGDESVLSGTF